MSTSPALPPLLVSASIAEEKKYQVRYERLWADCVEVGGEWLTEERWRAEGLLPDGDELHAAQTRRSKARNKRLSS